MHISSSSLFTEKKRKEKKRKGKEREIDKVTSVCAFKQINSSKKLSHLEKASVEIVRFKSEVKPGTTE
jgi:ribosomal protein L20